MTATKSNARRRAAKFLLTTMLGAGLAAPACAQSVPIPPWSGSVPQSSPTIDDNGVDLSTGTFRFSGAQVSTGGNAGETLAYSIDWYGAAERDPTIGWIQQSSGSPVATVAIGSVSETYVQSGSTYDPYDGARGELTYDAPSDTFEYTQRDGTSYLFDGSMEASTIGSPTVTAMLTRITQPNGIITNYHYRTQFQDTTGGTPQTVTRYRVQSITNNLGYQIHLDYAADSITSLIDPYEIFDVTGAIAINNAVEYCDPVADDCTGLTVDWPEVQIDRTNTLSSQTVEITDSLDRITTIVRAVPFVGPANTGRILRIDRSEAGNEPILISYYQSPSPYEGLVESFNDGAGVWNYSYVLNGSGRITQTTIDPPVGDDVVVAFDDPDVQRPTAVTDGASNTTSYQYSDEGWVTRVTMPEGNYTQYSYDTRGNVTVVRQVEKSGPGPSDIVTSADYPNSCGNPIICNRPTTSTDAEGNVTNYSWSATHGGLLSITLPDPDGGGLQPRPQTRYSYEEQAARYIQSPGGSPTDAPSDVWLLTRTESCATGTSCNGTDEETETILSYGADGTSATNLLLAESTVQAGDASVSATVSYTYDPFGNLSIYDGPLAPDDRIYYFWNAGIQLRGMIGVDPSPSIDRRARRFAYDDDGNVTEVVDGTATGATLADLNALTVLTTQLFDYDDVGRRIRARLRGSDGVFVNRVEYSYDAGSRSLCTVQRMNPSRFSVPPINACAPDAGSWLGPDRISRNYYDDANRILRTEIGVTTSLVTNAYVRTYSENGEVATLADGSGNLTTYIYDGFDRLSEIRYPNASGGGTSTTDRELYAYDANSNLTARTLRDGDVINFTYDNLNRRTFMDLPGTDPDITYAYDNFSRLTSASQNAHPLSFTYDALGRRVTETGLFGTITSRYRADNARTRITHPDGNYFQTNYYRTGAPHVTWINATSGQTDRLFLLTYDLQQRLSRYIWGDNQSPMDTRQEFSYSPASRVDSILQNFTDTDGDLTTDFTYNPPGQIATRSRTNAAYVYDGQTPGTTSYTANGLNQYTTVNPPGPGSLSPLYDGRGNLTAYDGDTFAYDSLNRLTSATVDGATTTFTYDPLGRLFRVDEPGTANDRRFLWDGDVIISEHTDTSTAVLRRHVYVPGSLGAPMVTIEGPGTELGDRRYLHRDERGSVIAIGDAGDGTMESINTYGPYGEPGAGNTGAFQYAGQMWLPDARLHYMRNRFYHSELGRFMTTDPIGYGDGMNLYWYAANDPVNLSDPLGLSTGADDAIVRPKDRIYVFGYRNVLQISLVSPVGLSVGVSGSANAGLSASVNLGLIIVNGCGEGISAAQRQACAVAAELRRLREARAREALRRANRNFACVTIPTPVPFVGVGACVTGGFEFFLTASAGVSPAVIRGSAYLGHVTNGSAIDYLSETNVSGQSGPGGGASESGYAAVIFGTPEAAASVSWNASAAGRRVIRNFPNNGQPGRDPFFGGNPFEGPGPFGY